jgi:hypothetical protein
MVHAKPIRVASCMNITGYKTPPKPPAVVARPVASPRLWENQWPRVAMLVVHRMEEDKPPRMPKERRKWWYAWYVSWTDMR